MTNSDFTAKLPDTANPLNRLTWHYENPAAEAMLKAARSTPVMGMLSLGAGICGYVGPQMLGVLRDWTKGFGAGWYVIAGIGLLTLIELVLLKRHSEKKRAEQAATA